MMTAQKTNEVLDSGGIRVFEEYSDIDAANQRIGNLEKESELLKKNWIAAERNFKNQEELNHHLQIRLKSCRRIMRDKGIGHLYPHANVQAEAGKMSLMEANSNELRQIIEVGKNQVGAQLDQMKNMRQIIGGLVSLLTQHGISAEEISRVLDGDTEADRLLNRLEQQKQFLSIEEKGNGDTSIAEGNQAGESLSA